MSARPPTYTRRLLRWLAADWRRAAAAGAWLTLVAVSVATTLRTH